MKLFEAVKNSVNAYDAALYYGYKPGRSKMICCPFHDDRHPSMKVDKRYYCFGCGAKGDVIDFVANLFGLSLKDAALRLATDFGIAYDNDGYGYVPSNGRNSAISRKQSEAEKVRNLAARLTAIHEYLKNAVRDYGTNTEDSERDPLSMSDEEFDSFFDGLKPITEDFEKADMLYEEYIIANTSAEQIENYGRILKEVTRLEGKYCGTNDNRGGKSAASAFGERLAV